MNRLIFALYALSLAGCSSVQHTTPSRDYVGTIIFFQSGAEFFQSGANNEDPRSGWQVRPSILWGEDGCAYSLHCQGTTRPIGKPYMDSDGKMIQPQELEILQVRKFY